MDSPIIIRPLDAFLGPNMEGRRGRSLVLEPGCDQRIDIFDFNKVCVRGELLGVVLSICRRPGDDKCPPLPPAGDSHDRFPAVRAHLWWGLGAATFYAVCDFLNGTQIGLVAESLRIAAEYVVFDVRADKDEPIPAECCLPDFNIAAGAGYGVRSHNSNSARLTELISIDGADEVACVPIPAFALSFTVQPIRDGQAAVEIVSDCGGTPVPYDVVTPLSNLGQHNMEKVMPLYNGARALFIRSRNGLPLKAFVIFGLAL